MANLYTIILIFAKGSSPLFIIKLEEGQLHWVARGVFCLKTFTDMTSTYNPIKRSLKYKAEYWLLLCVDSVKSANNLYPVSSPIKKAITVNILLTI